MIVLRIFKTIATSAFLTDWVHQIRFRPPPRTLLGELTALPRPCSWFRGPYVWGWREGSRRERERRRGNEEDGGTGAAFANYLVRPWLLGDRPQTPYRGFASGSQCWLPSARSRRSVPFYTIPDPPLVNLLHCEILLHAHGETHPNYHSIKSLVFGISWHKGVIWYHPMSDIICRVISTKYCHDFLIRVASMSSKLLSNISHVLR